MECVYSLISLEIQNLNSRKMTEEYIELHCSINTGSYLELENLLFPSEIIYACPDLLFSFYEFWELFHFMVVNSISGTE